MRNHAKRKDNDGNFEVSVLSRLTQLALAGSIAGDVVHSLNNLLQGITGHIEIEALKNGPLDPHSTLGRVGALGQQAAQLARCLLRMHRPVVTDAPADVDKCICNVMELFGLQQVSAPNVVFEKKVAAGLPRAAISATLFELVLANLVHNALQALGNDRGIVSFEAAPTRRDQLAVNIWNSGPPIPATRLRQLFNEPGTTKPAGEGTGIGLHLCWRLLHSAGGKITVSNKCGGVEFSVVVPREKMAAAAKVTKFKQPHSAPLRGKDVLVVDDDAAIREVMHALISDTGCANVACCADGQSALTRLGRDKFDAILLDLRMPGLSGQDVFRRMPPSAQTKVVFITGDLLNGDLRSFIEHSNRPILFKPVNTNEMLSVLRAVATS